VRGARQRIRRLDLAGVGLQRLWERADGDPLSRRQDLSIELRRLLQHDLSLGGGMLLMLRRILAAPALPFTTALIGAAGALAIGNEWLLWGSVGVLSGFSLSGSV
jgi:hypothetical protein